jgi:hypothetical protein
MKKRIGNSHYALLLKEENKLIIATTKTFIANRLGISTVTINRNINSKGIYETEEFIVWTKVYINTAKKGFALINYK